MKAKKAVMAKRAMKVMKAMKARKATAPQAESQCIKIYNSPSPPSTPEEAIYAANLSPYPTVCHLSVPQPSTPPGAKPAMMA